MISFIHSFIHMLLKYCIKLNVLLTPDNEHMLWYVSIIACLFKFQLFKKNLVQNQLTVGSNTFPYLASSILFYFPLGWFTPSKS
jgi:hypothetical protein